MKTSNKILLALGVFVFALPLFLAFTLKSKLEKGEYVLDDKPHYDGISSRRMLPETGYSVIKLKGPEVGADVFQVTVIQDSSAYFSYYNGWERDSVHSHIQSDTLFLEYATRNEPNSFTHTAIQLSIPKDYTLLIDGALVKLNEYTHFIDSLHLITKGYATLSLGTMENQNTSDSLVINSLFIEASGGGVLFANNMRVNNLNMDLKGDASLTVEKGAKVNKMNAVIGDNATIHAPLSFLKQLLK